MEVVGKSPKVLVLGLVIYDAKVTITSLLLTNEDFHY